MKNTNLIGINEEKSKKLSHSLTILLANYQVLYTNVRGFHWNIKGRDFFELHVKFEELYNNLQIKIDEIAERILTLGQSPMHSFSDYLKISEIEETKKVSDGNTALQNILDAFSVIIKLQRNILESASDANDEGTNALMSDYIREQEKLVWMYSAYLG